MFLLYLYENPWPTKAAAGIADDVAFCEDTETADKLNFENEITEEAREHKASEFWCYFKRWKQYFPMEQEKRQNYLAWAEKIVYDRADAIVKGQHRGHYAEVAGLLAMVAEIKEQMGMSGETARIFAEYKSKFPRHSSFQTEMKRYFGYL